MNCATMRRVEDCWRQTKCLLTALIFVHVICFVLSSKCDVNRTVYIQMSKWIFLSILSFETEFNVQLSDDWPELNKSKDRITKGQFKSQPISGDSPNNKIPKTVCVSPYQLDIQEVKRSMHTNQRRGNKVANGNAPKCCWTWKCGIHSFHRNL